MTYSDRDDIETVRDLDCKSIGLNVPESLITRFSEAVLNAANVEPAKIQYNTVTDMTSAIKSKSVDAVLVFILDKTVVPAPIASGLVSVDMKAVAVPEDVRHRTTEQAGAVWETVHNEDLNQKAQFDSVASFDYTSDVASLAQ